MLEGGRGQLDDGVGAQREAHQVAAVGRGEPGHRAERVGRQVQLYQVRQPPEISTPCLEWKMDMEFGIWEGFGFSLFCLSFPIFLSGSLLVRMGCSSQLPNHICI